MKVVHLYWWLKYGGIETMLVNIANEQEKQGCDVSIILINDAVEKELVDKLSSNIKVYNIGRSLGSRSFKFIREINILLATISPDIIHLHSSVTINFIDEKWRSRVCATLHAMPSGKLGAKNRFFSFLGWLVNRNGNNVRGLNRIRHLFAISNSVKEALWTEYKLPSKTVYNGIETSLFKRKKAKDESITFNIVQVGRLDHFHKGQDILIQALCENKLLDRDNVKLTFIGEGPSLNYLKELVNQKGLADKIVFAGKTSQEIIKERLCNYDLLVLPSRHEGFGLAAAEAMASGVPVLTSHDQGGAEVTCNEKYGWTFINGDCKDLANKIIYIINNKEKVEEKLDLACQYVKNNFDVRQTAANYIKEYKLIISQ